MFLSTNFKKILRGGILHPSLMSDLDLLISQLPANFAGLSKDEFRKISIGMTEIVGTHIYNVSGSLRNVATVAIIKAAVNKYDYTFPISDVLRMSFAKKNCKMDICKLILSNLTTNTLLEQCQKKIQNP